MSFEQILNYARKENTGAKEMIFHMYRPLLMKYAITDGVFDEDLYQDFSQVVLKCIKSFPG